ncbi:MAG: DUF1232 domain-containing protein [Bacteroidaceae bacterium]|nr:DUF1232 domain-containing protein [Bacteroidaceae bacterium]
MNPILSFLRGPYIRKAASLLSKRSRLFILLSRVESFLGHSSLADVAANLRHATRYVRDVATGGYKGYSLASLLIIVAGLVYLVSPIDAVPDFIVGLGLVDDAAILAYIFRQVNGELAKYRRSQTNK